MGGNGNVVENLYKELGLGDILLIEDDPWSTDSLAMFFRIVECRMQSAANAKEAITAMSRNRFDLILCEYQLPGMSGLTLMKMVGNAQPGAVKFLVTSYPIQKLAEEAARCGIHEVIRKPFTMATLEDSLIRYFPSARGGARQPVGVE
jgi:DNA-binding NtrC family response regulator